VAEHAGQQDHPEHPECTTPRQQRLAEDAQVVGVFVEGILAGEDLQVAVHMSE
jgi:hypothetical protein